MHGGFGLLDFSLTDICKAERLVERSEDMILKHKVRINVTKPDGVWEAVLNGGNKSIRSRFLNRLLGNKIGVLVLTPGGSVEAIEVREIKEGGNRGEQNE